MRLLRMLMTLMAYDYTIVHLPGKEMHLADTLSRASLLDPEPPTKYDSVNALIASDLTTQEKKELQETTQQDTQVVQLMATVQQGWPENRSACPPSLTPYWDFRDEMKCETCATAAPRQQNEPLNQPPTPERAWSCVSTDIMTLDGKDYLVTVDDLSGYFKVDLLTTLSANHTILKLRMIIARFGVPDILITDNGP